ncbi:P60-like protein [Amylostereum chailletii]|nr:P60-like protein [Amylostereum chailletii]
MSVTSIKSKAKSATASVPAKKIASSTLGAPAQHNQSSRKGKKAWRKNVDIEDMEDKLEGLREEERTYGSALHEKKNDDIFVVDRQGDDKIRRHLPKFSARQLTAHKILSQRSAVPAVFSRPTASAKKSTMTRKEKDRLLQLGRRTRKGPFNGVVDHDQFGEGSALMELSKAAKESGKYDVWSEEVVGEGGPVKAPEVPHPRTEIVIPAIVEPHAGTSYNPQVNAHSELIRSAHEIEERRLREQERLEQVKARILGARRPVGEDEVGMQGMIVDKPDDDVEADEEEQQEGAIVNKKMPERKTKQQRRKAERLRAEKHALAERSLRKRMHASVDSAKILHKTLRASRAARARAHEEHAARLKAQLQGGLAGQKLGKHKVRETEMDVQLGEELSESLRGLKPEGNLFKDRFLSMQHRALVEPRVPVLPTKRRTKMKEYEKHAWKRFDRE